jgi:hypothetical protein
MYEAVVVHLGEHRGDLQQNIDHPTRGQRAFAFDERLEGDAVEKVHREVEGAVERLAVIVNGDLVRVAKLLTEPDFLLELAPLPLARARREELDGTDLTRPRVPGAVHLPHRSRRDLLQQLVRTDPASP